MPINMPKKTPLLKSLSSFKFLNKKTIQARIGQIIPNIKPIKK